MSHSRDILHLGMDGDIRAVGLETDATACRVVVQIAYGTADGFGDRIGDAEEFLAVMEHTIEGERRLLHVVKLHVGKIQRRLDFKVLVNIGYVFQQYHPSKDLFSL